jgi:hypothetical protein
MPFADADFAMLTQSFSHLAFNNLAFNNPASFEQRRPQGRRQERLTAVPPERPPPFAAARRAGRDLVDKIRRLVPAV